MLALSGTSTALIIAAVAPAASVVGALISIWSQRSADARTLRREIELRRLEQTHQERMKIDENYRVDIHRWDDEMRALCFDYLAMATLGIRALRSEKVEHETDQKMDYSALYLKLVSIEFLAPEAIVTAARYIQSELVLARLGGVMEDAFGELLAEGADSDAADEDLTQRWESWKPQQDKLDEARTQFVQAVREHLGIPLLPKALISTDAIRPTSH